MLSEKKESNEKIQNYEKLRDGVLPPPTPSTFDLAHSQGSLLDSRFDEKKLLPEKIPAGAPAPKKSRIVHK